MESSVQSISERRKFRTKFLGVCKATDRKEIIGRLADKDVEEIDEQAASDLLSQMHQHLSNELKEFMNLAGDVKASYLIKAMKSMLLDLQLLSEEGVGEEQEGFDIKKEFKAFE